MTEKMIAEAILEEFERLSERLERAEERIAMLEDRIAKIEAVAADLDGRLTIWPDAPLQTPPAKLN